MYQEFVRVMNDSARAILQGSLARRSPVSGAWVLKSLAISSGAPILGGLVVWGLAAVSPVLAGVFGIVLALGSIVCLYVFIQTIESYLGERRYSRIFREESVPKIVAGLEDGRVAVKQVSATAVIEIVEFEDEGPGYIYDVGDGKLLFLKGQCATPNRRGCPGPTPTSRSSGPSPAIGRWESSATEQSWSRWT